MIRDNRAVNTIRIRRSACNNKFKYQFCLRAARRLDSCHDLPEVAGVMEYANGHRQHSLIVLKEMQLFIHKLLHSNIIFVG